MPAKPRQPGRRLPGTGAHRSLSLDGQPVAVFRGLRGGTVEDTVDGVGPGEYHPVTCAEGFPEWVSRLVLDVEDGADVFPLGAVVLGVVAQLAEPGAQL